MSLGLAKVSTFFTRSMPEPPGPPGLISSDPTRLSGLSAGRRDSASATVAPSGSDQSIGTSMFAHSRSPHVRHVTDCWYTADASGFSGGPLTVGRPMSSVMVVDSSEPWVHGRTEQPASASVAATTRTMRFIRRGYVVAAQGRCTPPREVRCSNVPSSAASTPGSWPRSRATGARSRTASPSRCPARRCAPWFPADRSGRPTP